MLVEGGWQAGEDQGRKQQQSQGRENRQEIV